MHPREVVARPNGGAIGESLPALIDELRRQSPAAGDFTDEVILNDVLAHYAAPFTQYGFSLHWVGSISGHICFSLLTPFWIVLPIQVPLMARSFLPRFTFRCCWVAHLR